MSGYRPEKVAEQIQREVTRLLMFQIKDPRVAAATITGVKVSRDIGSAAIYFIVADEAQERAPAEAGLKKAASFIRRELAGVMRLRSIPELRFQYDDSVGYGQKIDTLLRQVQDELDDHAEDN